MVAEGHSIKTSCRVLQVTEAGFYTYMFVQAKGDQYGGKLIASVLSMAWSQPQRSVSALCTLTTLDRRHFTVVRPAHAHAFEILP